MSGLRMLPAVAALLLLLAGCATVDESSGLPEPALKLTALENGRSFSVKEGRYVRIVLEENPTTGYMWNFRLDKDSDILSIAERRFLRPESSGRTGAPGVCELTVKAEKPGTVTLIGENIRVWENPPKPASTIKYRFTITP